MNSELINIHYARQKDQPLWDAYVLSHRDATAYHLFAWKRAISQAYHHRCYYLFAEANHRITGILPLVHIKLFNLVNELTALPYCDIGGCLSDNKQIQDALLSEALKLQQKLTAKKLHLRGPLQETSYKNETLKSDTTKKVRMLLDLPDSSEKLLASFKSKLRSQIRKAEKNGVTFRWGGLKELKTIYSVFSQNMHDLGSPVHSKRWLECVTQNYKERAKIGIVEIDNKMIGMGIILSTDRSVSIPWASTLREYNHLGPNMLLYWNFLRYSADNGYKTFDFGRSTEGEGTYKFKQQWGAQPEPLVWYTSSVTDKDNNPKQQQSNNRGRAASIWQKIPLPAANFIGPHLRKYISL